MKVLYLAFAIFFFCSCSNKNTSPESDKTIFSLKDKGWNIYTGENYRYGPSIIINDNGSIDAWFAAVGGLYGSWNNLFHESGEKIAIQVSSVGTVAQKFTTDTPFWSIKVVSPNWGNSPCGLTFSLYKWQENLNYSDMIRQPPIAEAKFENYKDGERIGVTNENKFPQDTYLWVISEGLTDQSGVWLIDGDVPEVTSYQNGIPMTNRQWQAMWTEEETSGDLFWDQASHQHSKDKGKTWTKEVMSLQPTEFSSDHYSVCDPGAAFWGGYYYLGYTSTENIAMTQNNVYVARSKNPQGPWEKWDGGNWSFSPKPVVRYDGNPTKFGAGEPSIVVVDNVVYFYYSWNDKGVTTRVATANSNDPNWPGNLTFHGTAIDKNSIKGADHSDVKYREDINKFQAIHTASRMTKDSYLVLWQSDDGIEFLKIGEIKANLMPGLHNCGWSGDGQGHMKKNVPQYLSYSYGIDNWGKWKTRWVEIDR